MLNKTTVETPAPSANTDHLRYAFWYHLAILLLGLILRLLRLNSVLWGDEIASWAFARRKPLVEMLAYALHDPTPPLYYLLLHFLIPLSGISPVILRLPSVLLGIALIPVVYWCLRQAAFSRKDALLAEFLVATSSVLIYYSQEARAYALLAFLGTLTVGILYLCMRYSNWWVNLLFALSLLLLVTTSYYGLALVAGEIFCVVIYRRWKTVVAGAVVVCLTCGLIAYQIWSGAFRPGAAGRPADLDALLSLVNTLSVGTIGMRKLTVMANGPLLAFPLKPVNTILDIAGFLLFMVIFYLGLRSYRRYRPEQRQFFNILLLCIVIPICLALISGSTLFSRPQWLLRGLITIWPLFLMVTVISLSFSRWKLVFVSGILVFNIFSLYPYYTTYVRFSDKPLFDELNRVATSDDLIISDPWYMYDVVDYYYDGPAKIVGYRAGRGWLDVMEMMHSNNFGPIPLTNTPKVKGNIYVYYRRGGLDWLGTFPGSSVFTFDDRAGIWREIDHASGEWLSDQ